MASHGATVEAPHTCEPDRPTNTCFGVFEKSVGGSLLVAKNDYPSTACVTASPTPVRDTVKKRATRRANGTDVSSTPPTTRTARLCVSKTTTAGASIATVSLVGIPFSVDG